MAQDPWEAAYDSLSQQAKPTDSWEAAYDSLTQAPEKPSQFGGGFARAIGQGLTFGFGEELESLPYLLPGGETREEALQRIRGEMKAYSKEYPKTAFVGEIGGGLLLGGGAGALRAGAARAAGGALARTAARMEASNLGRAALATGRAATTGVGQAAIGGFGSAEGDVSDRLKGAVLGGTVGAALPYAGRIPVVGKLGTAVVRKGGELMEAGQRVAAAGAERAGLSRVARLVEPTTAARIQRQAAEALPGSTTGPVASSLTPAAVGTPQAIIDLQIQKANAEAALRAAQRGTAAEVRTAQATLEQINKDLKQATRQAAREARRAQAAADAAEQTGKARRGKLLSVAEAEETAAEQQARVIREQARGVREGIPQAVAQTEEEALANAERNASSFLQRLRVKRGSAKAEQDDIIKRQREIGKQNYAEVAKIGPPPEVDPEVYRQMLSDPTLRSAYNEAVRELRKEALEKAPGRAVRQPLPAVEIDEQAMPEISLEMFDRIRRRVVDPAFKVGPNATGLSASQRRATLEQMNQLEERFLAGYGDDAAANALKKARTEYRAEFKLLEAIRDGLNLGSARPGKASGILSQSRQELDEVIARVGAMSDAERAAFQLGAREAIDRQIQRSQKGALDFLSKFGSEESLDKLRLAYGDEMVSELEAMALAEARKGAKAAGASVREAERQRMRSLQQQAEQLVESLTGPGSKAARARELAGRSQAQGAERKRALVEQKYTAKEAAIDVAEETARQAREAAGAPVRAAREARDTAADEVRRLAESLAQAKRSQTVAQKLPVVSSINQALGGSTQQQEFLQRVFPRLDATQQQQAATIIGSNVQRRLQDLARSGKSPQEILKEVQLLKQNDVVRQLFGNQIDAFAQAAMSPSFVSRIPAAVGATLQGYAGRRTGRFF